MRAPGVPGDFTSSLLVCVPTSASAPSFPASQPLRSFPDPQSLPLLLTCTPPPSPPDCLWVQQPRDAGYDCGGCPLHKSTRLVLLPRSFWMDAHFHFVQRGLGRASAAAKPALCMDSSPTLFAAERPPSWHQLPRTTAERSSRKYRMFLKCYCEVKIAIGLWDTSSSLKGLLRRHVVPWLVVPVLPPNLESRKES